MKIITQVFCLGLLVAFGLQACTEQDSKENGGDLISQNSINQDKSNGIKKNLATRITGYAKVNYKLGSSGIAPAITESAIDFSSLQQYYASFDPSRTGGIQVFPGLLHDTIVSIIGVSVADTLKNASLRLLHPGGNKFNVLQHPISRDSAISLIENYFNGVRINGRVLNKHDDIDKISRYYPWINLNTYFTDNGGNTTNRADYHIILYHGWVENDTTLLNDLFNTGDTRNYIGSADSLVGYTGLWELFRSNRSVTESPTSPNTRKGLIEEIAKPCPPRCDDLNGITKNDL